MTGPAAPGPVAVTDPSIVPTGGAPPTATPAGAGGDRQLASETTEHSRISRYP